MDALKTLVVVFLALSCAVYALSDDTPPFVHISHGSLKGSWLTTKNGRSYAVFKGIPYARPPIGKYRFRCCARGRPIIVEWERDARHSAGLSLSFGDSSLRYRALHFFKVTPSRNLI
ncbi:Esterase FE4 [Eumeta japonica]|uniref:Esterase FE4 n=1 Tax=Eumeta variegata TaxID=151549 RepID=A0A4C1STD1_EUMVA|nr:Esterase FE4 [Eumeta japonica]